jgi:glycosyltransferase involved in cell wall biosynthesis
MCDQNPKKPLVSCITIFFNAGETFFIEAVESIFAQTYDHWELLLVDDGSTDESTAIALSYAQQYPEKVRYLEHEGHQNRGMSATRNLGILHAKGDYIALLDADDIWLPQKLEKQVALLEAQPEAGMVYGSTRVWHSWTGEPDDLKRDHDRHLGVKVNTIVSPPTLSKLFLKGKALTPGTCSVLMRKEFITNVDGFEESFRTMFEDQAFFFKACLKSPVFVESGCWDRYRQHPHSSCYLADSVGHFSFKQPNTAHLTFLTWVEQYLMQQSIRDTEIWRTLNEALYPYKHKKRHNWLKPYRQITRFLRKRAKQLYSAIKWRLQRMIIELAIYPREQIMRLKLPSMVQHIYGPEQVNYALDELVVLCLVRNGAYYTKSFIEHYLKLGVRHIIFLDNGSTDDTIAIAQQYPNVTILQTTCLYGKYENVMKQYLVRRFSKNRWNLFADIDELFDYPASNSVSLSSLLTYLNENAYTAVVTQMLDLFSEHPLGEVKSSKEDSIRDLYTYYDISNLRQSKYSHGRPSNPNIKKIHGGIRKSLFRTENNLSKASLTFLDRKIKLFVMGHHTRNSRLADFSCVLLHYPFIESFYEKVLDAVQHDRYQLSASDQYQKYWEGLQQNPNLCLKSTTARQLKDINELLDNGFLIASKQYRQWVTAQVDLQNNSPTAALPSTSNLSTIH